MFDPHKMNLLFVIFMFCISQIFGQLCDDFTISSCNNDEYIIHEYSVSLKENNKIID